jgi:hypothetical protein
MCFFVADAQASGAMMADQLNERISVAREGFHLFFPTRGTDHWRVVGIAPPALRARDDLTLTQ